jgi:hypothetical protein
MAHSLRIDFSDAPRDPVKRLVWLSGAKSAFDSQVQAEWQRAYYDARLSGRFDAALKLGLHSKKRAVSFTRAENEARGRAMRWGDGFGVPARTALPDSSGPSTAGSSPAG